MILAYGRIFTETDSLTVIGVSSVVSKTMYRVSTDRLVTKNLVDKPTVVRRGFFFDELSL